MIFEKLKAIFTRSDIPEDTRKLFDKASNIHELLRGLDELLTRNEIEFNEVHQEIAQLEEIEREEMEKIRSGQLSERVKRNTLLYIKRLRTQMKNLEDRSLIYDKNINLQLNLIAKIQQIEAMRLKGVEESEIDEILVEFENNFEKYKNTMISAEVANEKNNILSSKEERELQQLEQEILASPTPKIREQPTPPLQDNLLEQQAKEWVDKEIENFEKQQLQQTQNPKPLKSDENNDNLLLTD